MLRGIYGSCARQQVAANFAGHKGLGLADALDRLRNQNVRHGWQRPASDHGVLNAIVDLSYAPVGQEFVLQLQDVTCLICLARAHVRGYCQAKCHRARQHCHRWVLRRFYRRDGFGKAGLGNGTGGGKSSHHGTFRSVIGSRNRAQNQQAVHDHQHIFAHIVANSRNVAHVSARCQLDVPRDSKLPL